MSLCKKCLLKAEPMPDFQKDKINGRENLTDPCDVCGEIETEKTPLTVVALKSMEFPSGDLVIILEDSTLDEVERFKKCWEEAFPKRKKNVLFSNKVPKAYKIKE